MADTDYSDAWHDLLTDRRVHWLRTVFRHLPTSNSPRCRLCFAPTAGPCAPLMGLIGRGPWKKNPFWCNECDKFVRQHPGGVETEATFFFADVRGSTALGEKLPPTEFSRILREFYSVAASLLTESNAVIDKFIGDEVVAFYLPYFAVGNHYRSAIQTAMRLIGTSPLPVGVGIHHGVAFIGSIGSNDGLGAEFTALGDTVNVAARLVQAAQAGEIVISEAVWTAAALGLACEQRTLQLKGHEAPIAVRVVRPG